MLAETPAGKTTPVSMRKDERDAHPRVPCGQTSRVAERLGSGAMSLAEVVPVVPSGASWSAGWQRV
jgi:hypothetical protein